ncbi:MAG: hypothetical protein WA461_01415, partial [Nitrososphaeraceae archaeon]
RYFHNYFLGYWVLLEYSALIEDGMPIVYANMAVTATPKMIQFFTIMLLSSKKKHTIVYLH